ncbi:leucine-rich melanocyte differentiation-associated protein-like [Acropora muricata]|uniref:leucine-rich melanocyte differentiation-associated protein-like n=1 Tax=Acropora muricata TaxID=159855 RepID=UPI0034E3D891
MDCTPTDSSEEGRISLAYRDLDEFPSDCHAYGKIDDITVLDVSHNNLSNFHFLQDFKKLNTLILDNNKLTSHVNFPIIESLHTLWVNHNKITNLSSFVETIAKCFPHLRYFSMMNNEAAPSYFNGGTYYQYKDYRCYVISHLPSLTVLDDHAITEEEREEARKIYGNRRVSGSSKRPPKKRKGKEKRANVEGH